MRWITGALVVAPPWAPLVALAFTRAPTFLGQPVPHFLAPPAGTGIFEAGGLQVFGSVTPGRADLDDLPQAEGM
ncbi:hypothetical protein [Streptomyces sp. NPDC000880]